MHHAGYFLDACIKMRAQKPQQSKQGDELEAGQLLRETRAEGLEVEL
jgi:hypothetical protein